MTVSLVVVCEAESDFLLASALVDRVILDRCHDWIQPEVLDYYRCWRGADDARPFLTWRISASLERG